MIKNTNMDLFDEHGRYIGDLPPLLDVNVFKYVAEALEVGFKTDRNTIGMSDTIKGTRQVVISKQNNIKWEHAMKPTIGTVGHHLIESREIRKRIVESINEQLGFEGNESIAEAEEYDEILPEQFLRYHPDILTPNYVIEIKFTAMDIKQLKIQMSDDYVTQVNGYAGRFKRDICILLIVNFKALTSQAKFEYVMNNLIYAIPFRFQPERYEASLERAEYLLNLIKDDKVNVHDLPCEPHTWSCKYCPEGVRGICGKFVIKCKAKRDSGTTCYKEIFAFKHNVTEEFMEKPICEQHYNALYPRRSWEKYVTGKAKPEVK